MLYYYPIEKIRTLPRTEQIAALRANILYMITRAGSGHLGSAMSALEIVYDLHTEEMGPDDIFITSKGHDCAALYAVLMLLGEIPEERLHDYRRPGGLAGHPETGTPGVSTHTGSLGMGISKAQGMALARRLRGKASRVFVLVGDGEFQEGQNFEAMRNLSKHGLDGIRIVVDGNAFQCDRGVAETGGKLSIEESEILRVCRTQKSAGLPWAGSNKLHSGSPTLNEYQWALEELRRQVSVEPVPEPPRMLWPETEHANPLREAWGSSLMGAMGANPAIVCLDADLSSDCGLEEIRREYGPRFIEFGISEQDMVSAAGGMALQGLIPVVNSFAAFLCRRANEQIYNNSCEGTRIVYAGHMAGPIPPGPGPSHECLRDVDLMKTMPGMLILQPENYLQIKHALAWATTRHQGPSYIRLPCLPRLERMMR